MQTLDYVTPRPISPALLVLPPVAFFATMFSFLHSNKEPFGEFVAADAIIQLGSPLLVAVIWLACAVIARRTGVPRGTFLQWGIVAVIHLMFAFLGGFAYLGQPWNQ